MQTTDIYKEGVIRSIVGVAEHLVVNQCIVFLIDPHMHFSGKIISAYSQLPTLSWKNSSCCWFPESSSNSYGGVQDFSIY